MAFNALRLGLTNLFLGLKLVWCVGLRLEDWFYQVYDFRFSILLGGFTSAGHSGQPKKILLIYKFWVTVIKINCSLKNIKHQHLLQVSRVSLPPPERTKRVGRR